MLIRNVGHLTTADGVLDRDGQATPEGILDAAITGAIALHDLNSKGQTETVGPARSISSSRRCTAPKKSSLRSRSVCRVEDVLGLPLNTLKLGMMDEEPGPRSISRNDSALGVAGVLHQHRLPRSYRRRNPHRDGSRADGPRRRDAAIALAPRLRGSNVDIGLACGLPGHAQIGKGMWAMPDLMAAMLKQKIAHPAAGASTAWVPSPTAATLHATHYHLVERISRAGGAGGAAAGQRRRAGGPASPLASIW